MFTWDKKANEKRETTQVDNSNIALMYLQCTINCLKQIIIFL